MNKKFKKIIRNAIKKSSFLIKLTTIIASCYLQIAKKVYFRPEIQFLWAQRFMGLGRLDLALAGFLYLSDQAENRVPVQVRVKSLRYAGIVYFLLGKNNDANYYWRLTGKMRKTLYKPTTPKKYRILGPGWHAALGHIAMLDFYIKYLRLYTKEELRIVAPWPIEQIPGQELLNKFSPLGIVAISPDELEQDYNTWAKKQNLPQWDQISDAEKVAMIDDFWEYEFPDGETLGFAYAISRIQHEWEQSGQPSLFSLSTEEKETLSTLLGSLGLPKDAWYVCLHVRESGFHQEWNSFYPSMRDADINTYNIAIEKIVEAGGWVLRMGDKSMKPLPSMPKVIDIAHSPLKTLKIDLLLAAGCRFLLGTNSGFVNLCIMYNIPCVLTNWVPIGWPLWNSQDLMIPKLFREKKSGYYLDIEQIFKEGLAFIQNWSDLSSQLELVANTPEDLAQVVLEMLKELNDRKVRSTSERLTTDQAYYSQIAQRYGAYVGNRLGSHFLENHVDFFSPSKTSLTKKLPMAV